LPSTFFEVWENQQEHYYPKAVAQQPPSESTPVFVETVPETFFEDWQTPQERYYPKAVAQQPNSYTESPFPIPETYFEAWHTNQPRFYPKAVAQQPDSYSAPVVELTPFISETFLPQVHNHAMITIKRTVGY
jgi:hypothetical protein